MQAHLNILLGNIIFLVVLWILTFVMFCADYYQCLPEADEVRKHVDRALETLQLDEDRDVRFFSGGKVEERISNPNLEDRISNPNLEDTIIVDEDGDMRYLTGGKVEEKFQNMTLEMALDVDNDSFSHFNGVRIIQRGIHEYAINDDDDDDTELVEEVYIEDTLHGTTEDGDIVMEEFYIDDSSTLDHIRSTGSNEAFYIEEIIEEIIES